MPLIPMPRYKVDGALHVESSRITASDERTAIFARFRNNDNPELLWWVKVPGESLVTISHPTNNILS